MLTTMEKPKQKMVGPEFWMDLLNVSRNQITRLIKDGSIPQPLILNRKVLRWTAAVVDSWLASTNNQ
jgi:predicted DNA-binding transcriptional regulator AlpA